MLVVILVPHLFLLKHLLLKVLFQLRLRHLDIVSRLEVLFQLLLESERFCAASDIA